MPILTNPRHERFAQGLAAGKSAEEAYSEAGFKPSASNASTLRKNQKVLERVTELLAEREALHGQATADAIKAAALTKQWVIDTLMDNVARAMQASEIKRADGTGTGEYKYEGSVANRALELLGKELGMFVERRQNIPASADLTDEHLDQRIRQLFGIISEAGTDRTARAEETPSGPQSSGGVSTLQ